VISIVEPFRAKVLSQEVEMKVLVNQLNAFKREYDEHVENTRQQAREYAKKKDMMNKFNSFQSEY